jgi:hypothetical protein
LNDELLKLKPTIERWKKSASGLEKERVFPPENARRLMSSEKIESRYPLFDPALNLNYKHGKTFASQLKDPVNLSSPKQLAILLYSVLDAPKPKKTKIKPNATGKSAIAILQQEAEKRLKEHYKCSKMSIEEIDEDGESRNKIIVYPDTPKNCYNFFARRNPHAHPAVLFRWSYFEKAECGYRPEYRQNQDTMLWLDGMSKGTKHANIPDVILRFRYTDTLFKKRRNGWTFAKKQLADRKIINKTLGYGFGATIFGYAMFCMLVSPPWIKKIAYRIFR